MEGWQILEHAVEEIRGRVLEEIAVVNPEALVLRHFV